VAEITLPQVESRKALEHQHIALERRLVETVQRLQLRDLLRVHAVVRAQTEWHRALGALAQFVLHLLDGAARHELDHDERERQHADERRNHQQQAFEDVAPHGRRLAIDRLG